MSEQTSINNLPKQQCPKCEGLQIYDVSDAAKSFYRCTKCNGTEYIFQPSKTNI